MLQRLTVVFCYWSGLILLAFLVEYMKTEKLTTLLSMFSGMIYLFSAWDFAWSYINLNSEVVQCSQFHARVCWSRREISSIKIHERFTFSFPISLNRFCENSHKNQFTSRDNRVLFSQRARYIHTPLNLQVSVFILKWLPKPLQLPEWTSLLTACTLGAHAA